MFYYHVRETAGSCKQVLTLIAQHSPRIFDCHIAPSVTISLQWLATCVQHLCSLMQSGKSSCPTRTSTGPTQHLGKNANVSVCKHSFRALLHLQEYECTCVQLNDYPDLSCPYLSRGSAASSLTINLPGIISPRYSQMPKLGACYSVF